MKKIFIVVIFIAILAGGGAWFWAARNPFNEQEMALIQGLSIDALTQPPVDPSNRYSADAVAAEFGHKLFFDTRLSANGEVACATCHQPDKNYLDGLALANGVGTTTRKTMTITGAVYAPFQFWDGRKDSLWAQALGPMESAVEHGGNRGMYAHLIAEHYADEYKALFGPLPDLSDTSRYPLSAGPVLDVAAAAAWAGMDPADQDVVTLIYVNMGKAIAAYERLILPGEARFDLFARALANGNTSDAKKHMNADEIAGLKLFIGRAGCVNCHNGPLFTNNDFHNTGVPTAAGLALDLGRADGAKNVLSDEFNCLSKWSDAEQSDCAELRYMISEGDQLLAAFKPPTLRNVTLTPPYMHAGQYATLDEVLMHYQEAPFAPAGSSEISNAMLTVKERQQIIAFLGALLSPVAAPDEYLADPFSR